MGIVEAFIIVIDLLSSTGIIAYLKPIFIWKLERKGIAPSGPMVQGHGRIIFGFNSLSGNAIPIVKFESQ